MRRAITLLGLPAYRARSAACRRLLPLHVGAGCVEALTLIEKRARQILDQEIYQAPRGEFARPLDKYAPDAMYQKFKTEFRALVGAAMIGTLTNNSPHAIYIEFGTDNEGTGFHQITAQNARALHWIDPRTGANMFAPHVVVQGIKPIRFMDRAMRESETEVRAILIKHVRRALGPLAVKGD